MVSRSLVVADGGDTTHSWKELSEILRGPTDARPVDCRVWWRADSRVRCSRLRHSTFGLVSRVPCSDLCRRTGLGREGNRRAAHYPGRTVMVALERPAARSQGLNLLRLALALSVVVSHAWGLTLTPGRPAWGSYDLGTWAVFCFFAISGYLILASRTKRSFGDFITRRVLRIFPGFVACLLVTVFVVGPVCFWYRSGHLTGYFSEEPLPLTYLFQNLTLQIRQQTIGSITNGLPRSDLLNAPLWTLWFEFVCYLVVGVLGASRVFRRHWWPWLLLLVVSIVVHACEDLRQDALPANSWVWTLMTVAPFFFAGCLAFVLRSKLPPRGVAGIGCLIGVVAISAAWPDLGPYLASPLLAYGLIWLGQAIRVPWTRHDFSYGVYIYGFLVQQVLLIFGAGRLEIYVFAMTSMLAVMPIAVASWFLVERRFATRGERSHLGTGDAHTSGCVVPYAPGATGAPEAAG